MPLTKALAKIWSRGPPRRVHCPLRPRDGLNGVPVSLRFTLYDMWSNKDYLLLQNTPRWWIKTATVCVSVCMCVYSWCWADTVLDRDQPASLSCFPRFWVEGLEVRGQAEVARLRSVGFWEGSYGECTLWPLPQAGQRSRGMWGLTECRTAKRIWTQDQFTCLSFCLLEFHLDSFQHKETE